ncbi:MAG: penicillin-binding protein 2 [Candidatus Puniceispirillaceae bacterium]
MKNKRKLKKELLGRMSRRNLLIGGGQTLFGLLLAGRLYQLQIAQNAGWSKLSDSNQFNTRKVTPARGRIFDSANRLLAGNTETYSLSITPSNAGNLRQVLVRLATIIDLPAPKIVEILKIAETQPRFLPITVKEELTQRDLSRLAIRSPLINGVAFSKRYRRIYPQAHLTGHITGYVSPVTPRELDDDPSWGRLPDIRTGKVGVEYALEQHLRGEPGLDRIEINSRGKAVRIINDSHPEQGADAKLTLNMEIQAFAYERLRKGRSDIVKNTADIQSALNKNEELRAHFATGDNLVLKDEKDRFVPGESGSAIVMDIKNGDVVAMVSAPSYDPNQFSERLLSRDWKRLSSHPRTPLLNRAISGLYAPGSTFKMVVAAAALEAGVISSKTRVTCKGHMEFGDRKFHCWFDEGHQSLNIMQALERSCDVFFYDVALKVGINRIHDMAKRLGLGLPSGLDLPYEKLGIIPNRDWKKNERGTVWTPGETIVAGIGQGFVLTTPLQLAVMTARLADGSKAIRPRMFLHDEAEPEFAPLNISKSVLRVVKKGMEDVMIGRLGTARRYDLDDYGIAGKTGTVQVKRITKEQREAGIIDNIDRPWKERDHALFVAYAPRKNPRYAAVVVVEHGGSGSSMAAPIARDILAQTIKIRGV